MKDTRPIAVQVNELTDEQKKTVRRVGICYDIIMCAVVIVYLAVALVFMVRMDAVNREIESFSFLKTVQIDGVPVEQYNPDAHAEFEALLSQQEQTMAAFVTVAGIGFVAVLAVMGGGLLIIAHKYPYYSDKRFVYIGRLNRKERKK